MNVNLSGGIASMIFLAGCISLASCSKNDDKNEPAPTPLKEQKVGNINADVAGLGQFTFYSLETGAVIDRKDSATTKWDIAFRATTILVNGGTSGPGKGMAQVVDTVFDKITTAPDGGYKADAESGTAIPTGSGKGWYLYQGPPTHFILPAPKKVLLIQTASGKYAKVEILSYYKDAPATIPEGDLGRVYTFRYMYQPNGSKLLK